MSARTRIWLLVASIVLFAAIAWQVRSNGPLVGFDMQLQELLQAHRTTPIVTLAEWATLMGGLYFIAAVSILCTFFLVRRAAWRPLAGYWICMIGAGASTLVLKELVYRPRPPSLDGAVVASSSFPSGNSILSAALFGATAFLVLPLLLRHKWLRIAVALAIIAPLLVAASRVILSVHYLSDTIAGLSVGLAWAVIASLVVPRA
ncbi:phosphatase PAP2 family protein [Hoeflea sp.]|uniref:phosphatase PAP2 family protein n=1 Tax=Hoeflea sp. TaxID=1940281 RepID=UPI003B018E80